MSEAEPTCDGQPGSTYGHDCPAGPGVPGVDGFKPPIHLRPRNHVGLDLFNRVSDVTKPFVNPDQPFSVLCVHRQYQA